MNPLISVIIPVYNVEKYIDRCITSIVEQTYKNLEIILVDDGSPDSSGVICDEWAKKDSRVIVYHKQNGGLSDARNFGTDKATAELITYIDSDDYILPEYVEYLYKNLIENDADISCCDFKFVYGEESLLFFEENNGLNNVEKVSGKKACYDLMTSVLGTYYVIAPCKLYKKQILKNAQYPVGRYHEDEATTYKYLYAADYVAKGDKKLYAYFQNESSIMHKRNEKRHKDCVWALSERSKFFKLNQDRYMEVASLDGFLSYYIYCNYDENKRFTKEAVRFAKQHWFNGDLSSKSKLKFLLYAISPRLYKKVINILFEQSAVKVNSADE